MFAVSTGSLLKFVTKAETHNSERREEREIIVPSLRQLFVSVFVTYIVRLPVALVGLEEHSSSRIRGT